MVSGPTKMPTGPKSEIPPSTEKRIKREDMFIFLLTIIGPSRLSIIPTMTTAQIKRPIPAAVCPVAKRKIIEGTDTKEVPKVGMRDVIAATTPQSAAFGIPKIQSPNPNKTP